MEIKPFGRSHLKRILEIERATFRREAYSKRLFLELYGECADLFLVAKHRRRIAGYMITCTQSGTAELVSIAVHPDYQKLGVGTALMKFTLGRLRKRGMRRFELMVRPANKPAAKFYRRFGFIQFARISHYYEDGGAALRMRKNF